MKAKKRTIEQNAMVFITTAVKRLFVRDYGETTTYLQKALAQLKRLQAHRAR
jgi:hypothetical protein